MKNVKKFGEKLKAALKKIEGKPASISGPSNCIRIVLRGGKEYWGTVNEVTSDSFAISVSYPGGNENVVVRMSEVASFSK